jgi:HTH-type transcriptional regulator/antitoxin HigA
MKNIAKNGGKKMNGILNPTYAQLVVKFRPRPIRSDEKYWETQSHIDALLDKGMLTQDEEDYLMILGMMVEQYEEMNEPEIILQGIELIRALMEEQGLSQRDLVQPIFKTDSIVSAVLNGKRQLTVEHIDKLSAYFHLPHALFFKLPVGKASVSKPALGMKPIGLPPAKPHPFVKFINQMDFNEWLTPSITSNKIKHFQFNNRRLRRQVEI